MSRLLLPAAVAASLLACAASAQRVIRVEAPIGGVGALVGKRDGQGKGDDEVGAQVELFENPNLDRYLRNAQKFLVAQDYEAAIEVLQDVIEGRTIEAFGAEPDEQPPEGAPGTAPAQPAQPAQPTRVTVSGRPVAPRDVGAADPKATKGGPADLPNDPAQTVFSQDGRLYRPVRRLCHELLATMPPLAIELYRSKHEVAADELLQKALQEGSIPALEQVCNRYFVTLAGGRAMVELADRFLHQGRYRAAVQVLRDLAEIYPPDNRRKVGATETWCRFKIALCLRLAGEVRAAKEAAEALAKSHADESLRIMGELQPVKELPGSDLFRAETELVAVDGPNVDRGLSWLTGDGDEDVELVPLWQFRYREPRPYRGSKGAAQVQNPMFGDGQTAMLVPPAQEHGPASRPVFSTASFPSPRAVFFDYFRLRATDAFSGLLEAQGDGIDAPPSPPREGHPRVRIAAYDHALYRAIEDEARWYAVLGYDKSTTASTEVLRRNQLVAYDKTTLQRTWSTDEWQNGEDGYKDVTFLAAPTPFGERLLLPVLRRGAYALQCVDRTTGRPLWCTRIHSGGSPYVRAPGTPVAVQGGVAYALTNAGGLAAVDAFAGDLKWVRRYERRDPLRVRSRSGKGALQQDRHYHGVQIVERRLPTFLPSDLVAAEGLIVFAPCDGEVLLCVDGASGEPVWMFDASSTYAPFSRLLAIVGANDRYVFAASDGDLVCFALRGGMCLWTRALPQPEMLGNRGRGVVLGDHVVMPGNRELMVYDANNVKEPRRVRLPEFGEGHEPLAGACNVVSAGPWLALGYEGGVEVFSTAEALGQLAAAAESPLAKASYLVQAGQHDEALAALEQWLGSPAASDAAAQAKAASRLLSLARERALALAKTDRAGAIRLLDRVFPFATDRTVRMNWHLARLDLWKLLGDLRQYEAEQQLLYRFMEGRE